MVYKKKGVWGMCNAAGGRELCNRQVSPGCFWHSHPLWGDSVGGKRDVKDNDE